MMQMIIETSAQEAMIMNSGAQEEEQRLMEQAIQESMRENPNPDVMSYEQLSELGEQIGSVSKGYTEQQLNKLPKRANFDYLEDCAI